MRRYADAFLAAFAATLVLSLLMVIKSMLGILPQFNVVAILAWTIAVHLHVTPGPLIGWGAHFLIGVVGWGGLYAALYPWLPGRDALSKALYFALLAWLAMMLLFLPAVGAGYFGLKLGQRVAIAALVLHLAWGAVLGTVFGMTQRAADRREAQ